MHFYVLANTSNEMNIVNRELVVFIKIIIIKTVNISLVLKIYLYNFVIPSIIMEVRISFDIHTVRCIEPGIVNSENLSEIINEFSHFWSAVSQKRIIVSTTWKIVVIDVS